MASTIILRLGNTLPSQGSGITLGEPAFNTDLHTFHIGLGFGVTAEMVGAPIVQTISSNVVSTDSYKIPSSKAIKEFVTAQIQGISGGGGGGASLGSNTFSGLNIFNAGISASGITTGDIQINGNLYITGYIISDGLITSKAGFRGYTADADVETLDELSIDGGEF